MLILFILGHEQGAYPPDSRVLTGLDQKARWFSISISSRIRLRMEGRKSFSRYWSSLSLGYHSWPVSSIRTVLLRNSTQTSSFPLFGQLLDPWNGGTL